MLSSDRLARIAIDSLSLWERIAADLGPSTPAEPHDIEARLKAWRGAVCAGDQALFVERLARDRLDAAALQHLLGRVEVPANFTLPDWCLVLNEVLEAAPRLCAAAQAADTARQFPYLRIGDPLPFEELLLPFVEVARARLGAGGGCRLPAAVLAAFARELLQKLVEVAARVVAVEFRAFLALRQLSGGGPDSTGPTNGSCAQYRRFVAQVHEQGWGPLFADHCVMARLVATAVLQWVAGVREFQRRLFDDLGDIERLFNRREPAGDVVAVDVGLSDPHEGGRTVIAVAFSSGLRVVYKPRSLALERAYFDFVAWINRSGALLPFRILTVLDRGNYGWVEYVEHRSCESEEEVRRYYRRTGHLLCLIYALNGSDFHFENLIADGEHPVPVDLETVFHHRLPVPPDRLDDADEIAARLRASVLATDLLPDPVKVDRQYFDISALGRSDAEEGEADAVVWTQVNTDAMDYRYARQRPRPGRNLPRLKGEVAALNDYTTFVPAGFAEAYRFLREHAVLLREHDGPLRAMFTSDARFIHRSTAWYALILRRALHPACLRDGLDFGIALDLLARDALTRPKPATWSLIQAEMASLWKLDIPRFTARGDQNALNLGAGRIDGLFVDSAWNTARDKLASLSEDDLQWQRSLIVGAFDVRSANLASDRPMADADEAHDGGELDRDALLAVAIRLAGEIERKAFRQSNGDLGWMVLSYTPAAERYTLQPMENDLYNGRAGVGLFFAALDKVAPGSSYGALAQATLAPIRRWIRLAADQELAEFGFGGYAGLSSTAYALARAGAFLGDAEMTADAAIAARRIRPEQIARDESLDIISGCAGAILALLACHAATGAPQALAGAIACGERLLQRRAPDRFGLSTWPTIDKRHLTGFSHGAAGIAYALLQLYKATGDSGYHDAARDGLRFERHAFVPEHNNWRDYRTGAAEPSDDAPRFSMAWCHGAPGIGLARIAALDVLDNGDVRQDIAAALAATGAVNLLPRDHLCCGNAGLMDTLCEAGQHLPDGGWSGKALRLAARTVARAGKRGSFSIAFHNGFFNPSLFQGAAGVGYQMLRLAEPGHVPSVLLLH